MGKALYTARQFINAIPGSGGIISVIARKIGCDWRTAHRYCTEYSTVRLVYEAEREGVLDLAETKLIEAIRDGDMAAIKFYLTTIGKRRGYTERQEIEHTGAGGGPIVINVVGGAKLDDL